MVLTTTARIVIGYDSIQGVTQVKYANPATPITLLDGGRLKSAVVILNDVNCPQTWTVAHEMIQVAIARIIIGKDKILVVGITQKIVTSNSLTIVLVDWRKISIVVLQDPTNPLMRAIAHQMIQLSGAQTIKCSDLINRISQVIFSNPLV